MVMTYLIIRIFGMNLIGNATVGCNYVERFWISVYIWHNRLENTTNELYIFINIITI